MIIYNIASCKSQQNLKVNAYRSKSPQYIIAMHEKPIANTTINGEMLETFLIRSGTRHGCSVLSYPFSIVLEVLDRASRREKENGVMSMGKDEVNFSLYTVMILYIGKWKCYKKCFSEIFRN